MIFFKWPSKLTETERRWGMKYGSERDPQNLEIESSEHFSVRRVK